MMLSDEIRENEAVGGPAVTKDLDRGGIHEEGNAGMGKQAHGEHGNREKIRCAEKVSRIVDE